MSRITRTAMRHLLDLSVLAISYILAFLIRFDGDVPEQMLKRAVFLFPYIVALRFLILYIRGVHRLAWRYVSLEDARRVLGAVCFASVIIVIARFAAQLVFEGSLRAGYAAVPFGVVAADTVLSFLGIVGIRVLWRLRVERASRRRHQAIAGSRTIPTLLVGAGSAGVQVVREMGRHPDLNIAPVGFVDDDPNKRGSVVHGVEVLGTIDRLTELVESQGAEQVLITMASAPNQVVRRIVTACEGLRVEVKIIPAISEIIDGRVEMSRIRSVSIEDLLGRDAISLDTDLTESFISGRRVAVTGAGGSIGSELCRQIARLRPESLLL
ncbi:MAG: polysaccharide biosynthesis protein, partial [Myxococcota bacterium]|nr:polysaccharide biosynthesis protein [Myxococcota bacterium]